MCILYLQHRLESLMALFLLRYAEMGLKSEKVRRRFQQSLIENIENHFLSVGRECIVSWDRGRIFVMTDDAAAGREVASHTFGIVSFSEAVEAPAALDELLRSVVAFAKGVLREGISFAIRARRSGQQKYTSMELAGRAGEAVLQSMPGLRVDLTGPDAEIFIEARERGAYIYSEVETGPGGLPMGTQGSILCPVYGQRDILAAWLMMRRGCTVIVAADDRSAVEPLFRWYPGLKTIPLPHEGGMTERAIALGCRGIAYPLALPEIAGRSWPKSGLALFFPLTGLTGAELERLYSRLL